MPEVILRQIKPTIREKVLPPSWFKTFVSANAETPQVSSLIDLRMFTCVLSSILEGSATWEDLFCAVNSEEQNRSLFETIVLFHKQIGIKTSEENFDKNIGDTLWFSSARHIEFSFKGMLSWIVEMTQIPDLTQPLALLKFLENIHEQALEKLQIVMRLTCVAEQIYETPEGQQALAAHKKTALDPENRSTFFKGLALTEMKNQMRTAMREEAKKILEELNIEVPEEVIKRLLWYDDGLN